MRRNLVPGSFVIFMSDMNKQPEYGFVLPNRQIVWDELKEFSREVNITSDKKEILDNTMSLQICKSEDVPVERLILLAENMGDSKVLEIMQKAGMTPQIVWMED